ncbi:pilin N-terminal domain-containing protein [Lactobacillus hominis]|uniref:pilin N-terminal domain-containing protein n=1 Tax=Lactobacillus hominis TaxID=1203033 RepID=UPI0026176140|nr:pilin N-terminal domain-containing protein [Lactobacillus hominis]
MKINKNKLYSAVLISGTVLSLVTPAVANAANENNANSSSEQVTVQKDKQNEKQDTDKAASEKNSDTKKDSVSIVNNDDNKTTDPDNPQTLKEQTMIINKVVAASEKDLSTNNLKGVNGAKFAVYDVTDLMNTIIKEEVKTDDSKASDGDIDTAIDKANENSKNQTTDIAGDKTDDKKDLKSTESQKSESEKTDDKDKVKLPPKYESGSKTESQSNVEDKKSVDQEKNETKDQKDDDKSKKVETDKSSDENQNETQSKEDKIKEDSSNKEESSENEALIKKVEELRKNDTIRKKVAERAAKLDPKEMKKFADVTTAHDDGLKKDGIAKVKIPIDGKYHAYYVVNTETPKEAMAKNSDPVVVITPITDDNGKYSSEFYIYPKSEKITPNNPESKKPVVTETTMYQTGRSNNLWNSFVAFIQGIFS